jgi:periplasmic protein TonB
MMLRWSLVRMTPVVASLLLHVVAYGAIAMVPKFTTVRTQVLIVDLVAPDPAPPVPAAAPARPTAPARPRPVDRTPMTLPTPVETPMPAPTPPPAERIVEPPAPPPPTPAPREAAPAAGAPSVATAPRATLPADATPAPPGGDGLPAAPPGPILEAPARPTPSPSAAAPAVAALPPDGVTRTAVPRGGYQVRPSYPANARRLGLQGTTLLSVFVAADGRVGEVVVKQSAGHADLDQAAAEAVRRWRFEPARRGNEAVAMWVLLPVEFRLR